MKKILLFIWIILLSSRLVSGQGAGGMIIESNTYVTVQNGYLYVGHYGNPLDLDNSGTFTIEINGKVTVYGDTDNSGDFLIKSESSGSGSFIPKNTVTGNIKVQRYVTGGRWNMITPVTSNVTAGTLMDTDPSTDSWLTYFVESDGAQGDTAGAGWYYIVPPSTPLDVGKGYCYWPTNNETPEFEGNVNSSDFPYTTLSYSGPNYGFNLVGNPYTSALTWDTLGVKWNLNNVDNTIWIYDGSTGNYNSYPSGVAQYNIALGQGFFVRATGNNPSMTAPETGRNHGSSSFVKGDKGNRREGFNYLAVKALNNGSEDNVYIYFDDNGTDDYDPGFDALKMFGSSAAPQLFAQEEKSQSYDFLPNLNEGDSRTVNLNYIPGATGQQKLIFDLGNFHDIDVVLEDTKTGTLQNINENNVYEFTGSKADNPARFLLHFSRNITGINDNNHSENNSIKIYSYANNVYVKSNVKNNNKAQVNIYDLTGKKLLSSTVNNGETIKKLTLPDYRGYVVVRVIKGPTVKTEKVFVH